MIAFRTILKLTLILISLMVCSCFFSTKKQNIQVETGEVTNKNIAEQRDLTQYDQGGHFYCENSFIQKAKYKKAGEKKVCDFVNAHLKDKRLGYIRITCNGVDVTNTFHIFIEPNQKDEWKIIERMVSYRADGNYTGNEEISSTEYDSLGCRKSNSGRNTWEIIYNIN